MPLIIFLLAIAFFSIQIVLTKRRMSSKHKMELFLVYLIASLVGVQGFIAFIVHIFYPDQAASLIGWKAGSPFQFEVGIANLAFSVLGFLAIYIRKRFWIAVIVGYSVYLWGAAIGHIIQFIVNKDIAEGNVGIYFISDIVTPCLLILTYIFFIKYESAASTWKGKLNHILNDNN